MNSKKKHHINIAENSKKVFDGVRYRVYQWEQEQFDGTTKTFETIGRNDTVVIFPMLEDGKILIVEEEQPHWGKSGIGLPGGCMDNNEGPLDGAKRELEEETGYVFKDFYLVHKEQYLPGFDWHHHIVIAKNLIEKTETKPDSGEKVRPSEISLEDLISKVKAREFFHRPVFIDEFIIQEKVHELFEILNNPQKFIIQT